MIRIIVTTCDFGAAANIGGPVENTMKSFDVEIPALEAMLREYKDAADEAKAKNQNMWWNRTVAGVEVVETGETKTGAGSTTAKLADESRREGAPDAR